MLYALSWFSVITLLALWSLAAWALHALAVWTLSSAGALSSASAGTGGLAWPDWLAPWLPPELAQAVSQWLANLAPLVDSLLQAVPFLASGLTVAAWLVWGLGSLVLLLLGAGLHLVIAVFRRRAGGTGGPTGGQTGGRALQAG